MSDETASNTDESAEVVWECEVGGELLQLRMVKSEDGCGVVVTEEFKFTDEEIAEAPLEEGIEGNREHCMLWNNSIDCLTSILLTLVEKGFLKSEADMCEVVTEFLEHLSNNL